jgi:hypothetical protein
LSLVEAASAPQVRLVILRCLSPKTEVEELSAFMRHGTRIKLDLGQTMSHHCPY